LLRFFKSGRLPAKEFSELNFFFRRHFSRLVFQHYRDAIPDGKNQPVCLADQFVFRFSVEQRSLAKGTNQNIEQFYIHEFVTSVFIGCAYR
jgi:hypothetical protein